MRRVALLLLALGFGVGRSHAGDDGPLASPIRAVLVEDDAGLRKVYDGVRKGLEQAALPRIALETVEDTAGSFTALAKRVEETHPPLLFLIGRRACERAIQAKVGGPRVFVDLAVQADGIDYPAAPAPEGPAALVRGVVPARRWGDAIRGMFPDRRRYPVRLPWSDPTISEAVVKATGLALAPDEASTRPGPLLLSDDVGRWGKGAVVILAPDHRLVGRAAAEVGRRLYAGERGDGLPLVVGATELRVDLDAADAAGIRLPLSFVAAADMVRAHHRREP